MSDLSAQTIRRLGLVSPFEERGVQSGMSYGLSCASYDVRAAKDAILWPRASRLLWTIEHFRLPPHISGKVFNKSTWARRFVDAAKTTLIDPGFCGPLQVEITNHCWFKAFRVRKGDPIAQVVFTFLDEPTEHPYTGKYQNQKAGIVGPRMEMRFPEEIEDERREALKRRVHVSSPEGIDPRHGIFQDGNPNMLTPEQAAEIEKGEREIEEALARQNARWEDILIKHPNPRDLMIEERRAGV